MTDFDDFDWVDGASRRTPGQSSSEPDRPRDYAETRGEDRPRYSTRPPGQSRGGDASRPPQPRRRDAAPPRATGTRPHPSASRPRTANPGGANRRSPQRPRTIWSQIGSGLRALYKKVAALPRPVLIAVGALLFVVVLSMILDSALYYNKIHAGISMGGQELSGKTRDEAIDLLTQQVESTRDYTVTVTRDSRTWTITPQELSQEINIQASVEAAVGRTRDQNIIADLARRLRLYFNSDNLPLIGEVDDQQLDAFLAQIAGELDLKPVNAGLSIGADSIQVVAGRSGFVVNQDLLREQLMDALFTFDTGEIQVPMMTQQPAVLADSTSDAETQVRTMLSADLHLQYLVPKPAPVVTTPPAAAGGDTTNSAAPQTTTTTLPRPSTTTTLVETVSGTLEFVWETMTLEPDDIAHFIDYKSEEHDGVMTLVAYISGEKMSPVFSQIEDPMAIPAEDAKFMANEFSFWIQDGKNGRALDYEATAAALTEAALSGGNRTAVAELKDVEPDLTTEEAHAMGINTELSRCTLEWEGTKARQNNVRMATYYTTGGIDTADSATAGALVTAGEVGGVVVAPGEEYNFAKLLGVRTPERGFMKAPGIVDGTLEDVYGGGICQVSTTLFNAVLDAGLIVTERWNHSWFINHYPAGKDATITAGGAPKNLRFVNNTPNYIWIYGQSDGETTTFVIYGTDDGREVQLEVSERYDVTEDTRVRWVEVDSFELKGISTTVVDQGQDTFKLKLTQVISWPNGSTTSTEFVSEWEGRAMKIGITTTTTTSTTLPPPATTTTTTGG